MNSSCMLDSPSSSTSALHCQALKPKRSLPARAVSQQFDESYRPPHPSSQRSSTRRVIRRLSRLFHRVRDQFVAHIPLFTPSGTPAPEPRPITAPEYLPVPKKSSEEKLPPASVFDDDPSCLPEPEEWAPEPSDKPDRPPQFENVDQFLITEDFHAEGQADCISVFRGERVELLDNFSSTDQDVIAVNVIDEETNLPSQRRGNVPMKILFAIDAEASCSTDRPQVDGASVGSSGVSTSKRTSIRRFFHNSSRDQNQVQRKTSPAPRDSPVKDSSRTSPQQTSFEDSGASSSTNHVVDQSTMSSDQQPQPHQLSETSMDEPGVAEPIIEENGSNLINSNGKTPQEEARYKRSFVIHELVTTEQDYVTDLELVVEKYMVELGKVELPEDLRGKDKIIFANIGQILDFHKNTFVKEIEKCLEDYEAAGTAFTKHERRLHTYYVKYCQNKPKSDFLISQEQFEQFFTEIRLSIGEKRTLADLLIKPVQRIQKYQLLMKDILKYTERAGDPMDKLRKGFEVMCIVPKACDDMMQVGRLQNFDGNLNAQGKLLFQGLLQISEFSPSQPFKGKERIVFLFEQSAIIADCIPKRNEFSSPTYIFKNQIMVNKMVLENNVADEPTRFVLRSNDPNQPIAFLCQANSVEEKEQWLEKINAQLDQQKTLLAALVDPKKYQNQLANSMGSMALSNNKKDSSGSLGTPGNDSPTSSLNSPKHSTPPSAKGSKLFGFNKKTNSARNPTSPH